MQRSSSNSSLFNFSQKNNLQDPLLSDQGDSDQKFGPRSMQLAEAKPVKQNKDDSEIELALYDSLDDQDQSDEKHERKKSKTDELKAELALYYPLTDPLQEPKESMDEKYSRMDRRLHKIQDRLHSRWVILLRQLKAPENRPFRRYLYKQLCIGGALSGGALGSSLVIAKGVALINYLNAASNAFYIDTHFSLSNRSGVYNATCHEATSFIASPYLCDLWLPSSGPTFTPSYNEIIKTLCEPPARILCSNIKNDIVSWITPGGVVGALILVALVIFCVKLINGRSRPRLTPVHETNILPTLSSDHKEFLIESGVIAPTDTEIDPQRLSNQINQKRRQFGIFASPDAKTLPPDISLIMAQYDEEVPLPSLLPVAGDLAAGKVSVLPSSEESDENDLDHPSLGLN